MLMTVYISDMQEFSNLNNVYREFFGINPPARVTVETKSGLALDRKLQIDCLACKLPRSTLHVQGISYWAPANIGPYSQATCLDPLDSGNLLCCAGQIGLVPCTMQLADSITSQALVSLRHVDKVVEAMIPEFRQSGDSVIAYATCYVTDPRYISLAEKFWTERHGYNVPIVTVSLSGLPRGALVEWHVVGGRGSTSRECATGGDKPWELQLQRIGATAGVLIRLKSSNMKKADLYQISDSLRKALDKAFPGRDRTPLIFARVFYTPCMQLKLAELYTLDVLKGLTDAITYVPVEALDGKAVLTILLHHSVSSLPFEMDPTDDVI